MNQIDTLKNKTISGVKWSGIGQLLVNLFDFAIYAVLARILFPRDFGVFAMATVFTGLIAIVNQLGLEIAIVQRSDIDENQLSTSFWVVLGFGLVLFLMVVGSAHFFAGYFTNPLVKPVLIVLSINFIVMDLGFVHCSLLQRRLEFRKIAFIETVTVILGGSVSILMALAGWGVWSLVGGWIGQSVVRTLTSWLLCDWRPRMIINYQSFKVLFAFGKKLVAGRTLFQLGNNAIHLLIGGVYGESVLGIYHLATRLAFLPTHKLAPIISRVVLPVYSSIKHDNETINFIFLKKMKYISLVTFPFLFGLWSIAPRFIELIYGYKWTGAVFPLQIFCVLGLIVCFHPHAFTVLRSKGHPEIELRWSLLYVVCYPLSFLITYKYLSVNHIFMVLTVSMAILTFKLQLLANSLINLKLNDLWNSLYPATISSTLMALSLFIYEKLFGHGFAVTSITGLLIPVLLGGVIFLALIRFRFKEIYQETRSILAKPLSLTA